MPIFMVRGDDVEGLIVYLSEPGTCGYVPSFRKHSLPWCCIDLHYLVRFFQLLLGRSIAVATSATHATV